MMYKGFWFQQKCSAAASRVDCYSDAARKGLVQVILPWNGKYVSKSWARQKKRESEGGRVGVCLYLCYCQIPGLLEGKPACRPTGTAPQKTLKEARGKLTFWQPGLSCYQDNRLHVFAQCPQIISLQRISLCASLELHPGSHTCLLNNSCPRCVRAQSLRVYGK